MHCPVGGDVDHPDELRLDLDPQPGTDFADAVRVAAEARVLLGDLGYTGFPKTSGKRGIHVFVPLAAGHTYEQMHDFACTLAEAVTSKVPTMTVERSISKRRGRLYLDCEQNAYGKTVVAPYSLRAIDGAPVSAPLKWSEITRKLDPLKYNIKTMPKRVDKVGDLFEDVFKKRVKLPKLS